MVAVLSELAAPGQFGLRPEHSCWSQSRATGAVAGTCLEEAHAERGSVHAHKISTTPSFFIAVLFSRLFGVRKQARINLALC